MKPAIRSLLVLSLTACAVPAETEPPPTEELYQGFAVRSFWSGTRQVDVYANGFDCEAYWDTTGEPSSRSCEGCTFAVDLKAAFVGSNCEGIESGDWTLTLARHPAWEHEDFGVMDALLAYYDGDWYYAGTVSNYTYASISYFQYIPGETMAEYQLAFGRAQLDPSLR